jgi:hypothetical protein
LLDKLKSEEFPDEQEIISRTKIQELVAEMDSETADNEAKITIYEYDKIIPRWEKEYDTIVKESIPKYIFITHGIIMHDYQNKPLDNKIAEEIFDIVSNKTYLSKELLKENNIMAKKYHIAKVIIRYVDSRNIPDEKNFIVLIDFLSNPTEIPYISRENIASLYDEEDKLINLINKCHIQSIPSPKAEPFKLWIAQVAKERLDQMQDPELSIEQAMMDYKAQTGKAVISPFKCKTRTFVK